MGFVEAFRINGRLSIETTVTSKKEEVDEFLPSNFLYPSSYVGKKVVGLDTEWTLIQNASTTFTEQVSSKTKCATLSLCDGDSCLIVQLLHLDSVPTSLLNFLRLPDYTFVGVGIKENLAKLEKQYGFGCRNAMELGPLAASVMKNPRLSYCGIDELASEICKLHIRKKRPSTEILNDWGQPQLCKQLAKLAALNVHAYHEIGYKLLVEDDN